MTPHGRYLNRPLFHRSSPHSHNSNPSAARLSAVSGGAALHVTPPSGARHESYGGGGGGAEARAVLDAAPQSPLRDELSQLLQVRPDASSASLTPLCLWLGITHTAVLGLQGSRARPNVHVM
jgi:hypothetical protein